MRTIPALLAVMFVTVAVAQTTPPPRTTSPRTPPAKDAGRPNALRPPDPDLFDGTRFEKEVRPEVGMIGEFEMPGSADSQDSKVGGNPGAAGGSQPPPPNAAAAGAAGAAGAQSAAGAEAGSSGGAAAGSQGAGGGSAGENAGQSGAVGGALDQSKPMSNSGQSGAGGSSGSPEGMAADQLGGGGAAAAAAAKAAGQAKSSGRIGSAELRIETLPESEKDVVGREAAPGGTQGSNRAMPAGKGGQGAQNQNKGVEKGKVMPKGL